MRGKKSLAFVVVTNIIAPVVAGGQITIGAIYPIECAITACEADNVLVMLQRREGETLAQMLDRLDTCIAEVWDTEEPIDEIHAPR